MMRDVFAIKNESAAVTLPREFYEGGFFREAETCLGNPVTAQRR
jgi:hypothetical protein